MRRWRRVPLQGALLAGIGLWAGCAPPFPLRVEYAGCSEVHVPGPVCALKEDRVLWLWVDLPPETKVEVLAGGRRLETAATPVQGGQRLHVKVPPDAKSVEVRAGTPKGRGAWSLALGPVCGGPGAELSRQSRRAYQDHDLDTARKLLTRAVAVHRKAGSLLAATRDAAVLVWIEIDQSRLAAARQRLKELRLPDRSPAEAFYHRSYQQGLLAEQAGDARSALANLQAAVAQAERVGGLERERLLAEQVLARQLQALGRTRDAGALFDRLRRSPAAGLLSCDEWAELLVNQAWSRLLAGEAGEPAGDPTPLFKQAHAARSACSPSPSDLLNLRLNLALAHLQQHRPREARAVLDEAQGLAAAATTPLLRLWSLEVKARLALVDGEPETALQIYGELDRLAATASSPEGRWRAAYGRARCYRDLGRSAEALDALAQAESLLDAQSLQIPVQEGRETFVAQRESGTRLHLALLLARGHPAEALEVARRARSRVLRQLARGDRLAHLTEAEQKRWDDALAEYWNLRDELESEAAEDWKLPSDQLNQAKARRLAQSAAMERALDQAFTLLGQTGERGAALPGPGRGEVILAYHPLPQGWVGFAADGRTVAVHTFDLPDGILRQRGLLAARLLVPFRDQIERARRVRILPYGLLRDVDFHALPFGGGDLLAACPVVYGLDLAAPPASPPPAGRRRALVVANPLGDLPAATREAGVVTAALRGQGPAWSVASLAGNAASAAAVRRALSQADLFHYAGHGIYSGFGGWGSVLPLAGETRLTLGDLLALDRAPSRVVLSGCETGRSSADAPVEGLGLAHAFLLAGSRSVVAATRPVGDRAAQGLFAVLYQRWGLAPDPAAGLQSAQLAWRRHDPTADWASFRLLEP